MRRNKGVNGLAVFIELNATCAIVEVKHRIQRVVIRSFPALVQILRAVVAKKSQLLL